MIPSNWIEQPSDRGAAIALGIIAVVALLSCCGCGATVTINVLSSQSRFVHAVGTNQTSLATEGGGGNSNKAALTP
jgi:hypothetical protein